jgi:hypothetical protein
VKAQVGMVAVGIVMFLAGCDGMPNVDAGPSDAGYFDPLLEVGTGEGSFSSFEDGDTLRLFCGTQGLQHVWIALRAWGIDPRGPIQEMELRRDVDGEVISQIFSVRLTMGSVAGQPYHELVGLQLVVPEPDRGIGEDLTVWVRTSPMNQPALEVERDIRIDWETPEGCLRD